MSPKSLVISGAKNEPSGHDEVLLLKVTERSANVETLSLYIAKF